MLLSFTSGFVKMLLSLSKLDENPISLCLYVFMAIYYFILGVYMADDF